MSLSFALESLVILSIILRSDFVIMRLNVGLDFLATRKKAPSAGVAHGRLVENATVCHSHAYSYKRRSILYVKRFLLNVILP